MPGRRWNVEHEFPRLTEEDECHLKHNGTLGLIEYVYGTRSTADCDPTQHPLVEKPKYERRKRKVFDNETGEHGKLGRIIDHAFYCTYRNGQYRKDGFPSGQCNLRRLLGRGRRRGRRRCITESTHKRCVAKRDDLDYYSKNRRTGRWTIEYGDDWSVV